MRSEPPPPCRRALLLALTAAALALVAATLLREVLVGLRDGGDGLHQFLLVGLDVGDEGVDLSLRVAALLDLLDERVDQTADGVGDGTENPGSRS